MFFKDYNLVIIKYISLWTVIVNFLLKGSKNELKNFNKKFENVNNMTFELEFSNKITMIINNLNTRL